MRHVHPRKAQEQEEARQDERDARDDPTPDPVEQPAHVRGELHRLRARQQHAVAERVEVPALVDPAAALDELLMHQGDLPRGTAEVHESEPDPEARCLAERGGRGGRRSAGDPSEGRAIATEGTLAGARGGRQVPMQLTPTEEERLRVFTAAQLARPTLAKGLRLNAPEAVALVCDEMHAAGRGGGSFDEVAAAGRDAVRPDQVLDGVAGDRLGDPRGGPPRGGDAPVRPPRAVRSRGPDGPGAIRFGDGDVELAPGRERIHLTVTNRGEHPIRVSSHFPFWRSNEHLAFDREAAEGFRLDLPAGDSLRWAPGETHEVDLVRYGGDGGLASARALLARRARDAPRSDRRRPDPAGRHRPVDPDRTRPDRPGRPGAVGLREELALRDGPARPRDHRERARHDRRERGRAGPAPRRPEGGHRHQGRPDRRDRARRQPGHHRRRRPHDRPEHLADPVPRPDRDAGRRRLARAPALPAARARRPVRRA